MSNNEPAFPVHTYVNADGETFTSEPTGMTLRDYFAAKAMAAFQISEVLEAFRRNDYDGLQSHNTYIPLGRCEEYAQAAYRMADAMIRERVTKG